MNINCTVVHQDTQLTTLLVTRVIPYLARGLLYGGIPPYFLFISDFHDPNVGTYVHNCLEINFYFPTTQVIVFIHLIPQFIIITHDGWYTDEPVSYNLNIKCLHSDPLSSSVKYAEIWRRTKRTG